MKEGSILRRGTELNKSSLNYYLTGGPERRNFKISSKAWEELLKMIKFTEDYPLREDVRKVVVKRSQVFPFNPRHCDIKDIIRYHIDAGKSRFYGFRTGFIPYYTDNGIENSQWRDEMRIFEIEGEEFQKSISKMDDEQARKIMNLFLGNHTFKGDFGRIPRDLEYLSQREREEAKKLGLEMDDKTLVAQLGCSHLSWYGCINGQIIEGLNSGYGLVGEVLNALL